MFVLLLVLIMTAIVSVQFREWLVSKTVFVSLLMAYTFQEKPDVSNDSTNIKSRNVVAPHMTTTTKAMPPTCAFPQVNVYEPSVMKVTGMKKKTLHCEGNYLPDLVYITADNKLQVNTSKVEEYMKIRDLQQCRYRHIFPGELGSNSYTYSDWSQPFTDFIPVDQYAEFLKVECTNKQFEVVSKTFHWLIPRKAQSGETDSLNFKKHKLTSAPKETLNVVIIGVDSLSRNQFLRACNKTYSYLINILKSFDLTMHSQTGDSISTNMWPLFSGYSKEAAEKRCSNDSSIENVDLIWRNFENAGYRTLSTEDNPTDGVLKDLSKCSHSSVRYDTRPLTLAMHSNQDMYKRNYYCSGNQLDMTLHLNYVRRLLDFSIDKPVFAVAMLTRSFLKDPTSAKMFDEHLLNFYKSLNENSHLNRSLIVTLSGLGAQHGALRNSVNGNVESMTPYTFLTFPDWFLKKYEDVAEHLKQNTKRLTSHFDTHATLLDLLYFKGSHPPLVNPHQHGVSLMKTIAHDRTCTDAFIPPECCLCGYTYLEEVYLTSQLATMLAKLVIQSLNSKADENRCALFKLQQIIRIQKFALDDYNSKGTRSRFAYHVKVQVKPGKWLFAASVFELNQFNEWRVGTDLGRLDNHRGQSECLELPNHRPFCFCTDWLSEESNRRNKAM